jgi:phosphohistidine phosphatase SixA
MVARRGFIGGALALAISPAANADDAAAWARLRPGGLVLLMRHASTEPGLGDPPGFKLGDCATQRNLSQAGRAEAERVRAKFAAERIPVAHVFTSPWCRCRETAMLAFGRAEDWMPLASFFDFPDREREYNAAVKRRISLYARRKPAGNVIMVTHNVNIAALSRQSVAPAELVVMRPEGCCDARMLERLRA